MNRIPRLASFAKQLLGTAGDPAKVFRGCRSCPDRLSSVASRAGADWAPEFPVDVVYAWVDGSEEAHAGRRRQYAAMLADSHAENLDPARFRDNGELRYSLRSLEQFAPWVNRIHIVSDSQTPPWLDVSHPRIAMVRHEDVIPERHLPTFNSHVIESRLHRIPGLSEHYLYFNDDFFLTNRAEKGDFFTANGLPFLFCDWRRSRRLGYCANPTPHAASWFNTIQYMKERGLALRTPPVTAHGPYPMTRACAEAAFAFFGKAIEEFSANKFRTTREMAFYCHAAPLWAYAVRRAVPCDRSFYYFNVHRHDRRRYYQALLSPEARDELPLFICCNDIDDSWLPSGGRRDLASFLSAFYKTPSAFEKEHRS